jgi:quercetin dioxygenase-like cupin family protein
MGAGTDIRPERSRHPTMHRTPTLDIGFVQSGEIWALMEDGEVLLKEGDFLVQRATLHGWSNRSDRPCTLIGVLVHGEAA